MKLVKCIDGYISHGYDQNNIPITGNIYEVIAINLDTYYSLRGLSGSWRKSRFTVVDDEVYAVATPRTIIMVAKILDEIKSDQEEERLRKMLCPSIASHECPCGIARSQCSYHR